MTAYTEGREREEVRAEMRLEIYQIMATGALAELVPGVDRVALLNDALDVATISPTRPSVPQSTPSPILPSLEPAITPQFTSRPTAVPVTDAPVQSTSASPTTDEPTVPPTASPSTAEVMTEMSTVHRPTPPTDAVSTSSTIAPSTNPNFVIRTVEPTEEQQSSELSANNANGTQDQTLPESTRNPNPKYYKTHNTKNAFQKVPAWGWVFIVLGIVFICTYTDPSDEDEHDDRARRNAMKNHSGEEQPGNEHYEYEDDKDAGPGRESHGNLEPEYFRKLYRQ